MLFLFDRPFNIVQFVEAIVGWGLIIYWVVRRYKRQERKPVIWKMIVVAAVGLFSFSITLELFGQTVKLAILPLGVWIVFIFYRSRSWNVYRRFAWIGFIANYIFLVITLLAGFIHHAIYDQDKAATFLADVREAEVVGIHPSAKAVVFDPQRFDDLLGELQHGDLSSNADWYMQSKHEHEPYYQQERFPYALLGAESSWGSGLQAAVYVRDDGKGLLIVASDRTYYYLSEQPLIRLEVGA